MVTRNGIRFGIAIESTKLTMVPMIKEIVPKAKSSRPANVQILWYCLIFHWQMSKTTKLNRSLNLKAKRKPIISVMVCPSI